MKFFKLTRPDGQPVYLSETGMTVELAIAGEAAGRTRITIGGVPRFVTETVDEALRRMGADVVAA